MNFKEKIQHTINNLTAEKDKSQQELDKMEEDFANVKLNPYGITSIDFTRRQELAIDALKMEGVLMGLTLALETFEESEGVAS
jgi:cell division protein FtsL